MTARQIIEKVMHLKPSTHGVDELVPVSYTHLADNSGKLGQLSGR